MSTQPPTVPTTTVPIGTILPTILTIANLPPGWYLCNGQTVSAYLPIARYIYPVNGQVCLPKLCGLTLVGAGPAQSGTNYVLGNSGGEELHMLTVAEMPAHTHQSPTNMDGNPYNNGSAVYGSDRGQEKNYKPFTTGSTGGNQPHNNMQPYYVVNYIIYCGIA